MAVNLLSLLLPGAAGVLQGRAQRQQQDFQNQLAGQQLALQERPIALQEQGFAAGQEAQQRIRQMINRARAGEIPLDDALMAIFPDLSPSVQSQMLSGMGQKKAGFPPKTVGENIPFLFSEEGWIENPGYLMPSMRGVGDEKEDKRANQLRILIGQALQNDSTLSFDPDRRDQYNTAYITGESYLAQNPEMLPGEALKLGMEEAGIPVRSLATPGLPKQRYSKEVESVLNRYIPKQD